MDANIGSVFIGKKTHCFYGFRVILEVGQRAKGLVVMVRG